MEIEYSNFELDKKIFNSSEIIGLVDLNSNFIYNRIYDIKKLIINPSKKLFTYFIKEKILSKKLLNNLMTDLYIDNTIFKKMYNELSTSEQIKIQIIKLCLSKAKIIILENIDAYLNDREISDLFFTLKKYKNEVNKVILFSTTKVDNIINTTEKYIIASENRIIYSGNKLTSLHEKTEIMKFVDIANKKGAKLDYYKDPSDLLKAIYRSVK